MTTIFTAILVALAAAVFFFFAYGRAETWNLVFGNPDLGPFDRTEPQRARRPNDALLCTPGLCEGAVIDAELPDFAGPPERLIDEIDAAMRTSGEPVRRVDDTSNPTRARFVTWTPLMRFPDTASFEAVPLENGRVGLVAYGRAQIGYSDGGVNRRRLEGIVSVLNAG
ncbi:DUF1499 domain-containing protein [Oricola thermophila]|uniref:DUF1499 domain-containing protein n=1 Tax=Oricola thermophila TaxID=2742145 RepID=A0A6N1VDD3_9HYPH|nr:DUF1499 domain-containing protein [Oricola thermophila]QKV17159.1 DUF1499 domain-containing protein [Oricola thermophila]